jgi:acyl-CoA dehydrogenase
MNDTLAILEETVNRLFAAGVTKELLVEAEGGGWPVALWKQVAEGGLTRPHLPEEAGGAGGGWHEAAVILRASGRYSVPLPLAETVLGAWLLARAGIEVPEGPLTVLSDPVTTSRHGARLDLSCSGVPWGRVATHAVFVSPHAGRAHIGCVSTEGCNQRPGHNLALEPRDDLRFTGARVIGPAPTSLPAAILQLYGAMTRAVQMAGALEALLEMSVQYAGERRQFGRPIAQFQAIQQDLARLAGDAAAAGASAAVAVRAAAEARADFDGVVGSVGDPTFEIATAKVVVGDAAESGPRIAHQVHGAIGFTYEHALHFTTRRLWSWRAEFGGASHWATLLGRRGLSAGPDGLWPLVTAR